MNILNKIKAFLILFLLTSIVYAQGDSDLNKEVEVIKAYQPSISDAYKIGNNPLIKDTINYSPTFDYRIYSNDIPVEKNINHLPVVKLGNPPQAKANTGYAKGGFGNAITPYGEVVINTAPTKKTDFGLHLFHFSSNPSVTLENDLKVKAPYGKSLARIFTKNYFRKSVMEWDVAYNRSRNNYYGFPGTDSTVYRKNELSSTILNTKQVQNTASASMKLKNMNSRSKIDYQLGLDYDFFWNTSGQTAHHAEYNGLFTKKYRKSNFLIDSKFEYFLQDSIVHNFDSTLTSHQYYHAAISPQFSINKDTYELKVGFIVASMINTDSTLLWNISPKIYFAYHPIKGMLAIFAGADGGFMPKNYQVMISKNPFVNPTTDLKPSEEVISFYGGLKGKISRKLSYLFDVNYSINQNENFYYFMQTSTNGDISLNNTFKNYYDDVNILKFGGNLRYSSPRFTLELKGNYYVYDAQKMTILSHMPDFDATLITSVQITDKIKATLDATVIGPRQTYFTSNDTETPSPGTTRIISTSTFFDLKTITDINLGAEYSYSKKLNFFISAQNILNQNYELWQGYNSHGLLILLGGCYTF